MVNLVVAMQCEARPIAERFAMERDMERAGGDGPFHIYQGENCSMIVSGVGKLAAASGAAFLSGRQGGGRSAAWLNVGVCGHATRDVGEGVLANKVIDAGGGKSWFPAIAFEPPCPTETLLTVDRVELEYAQPYAYEMEAAGFCSAAARFTTAELAHCYKIVSDNRACPADKTSAAQIERLIEDRLETIDLLCRSLEALAAEVEMAVADPPGLGRALDRWRFTATEREQLRGLLRRREALDPGGEDFLTEADGLKDSNHVLRHLRDRLDDLAMRTG